MGAITRFVIIAFMTAAVVSAASLPITLGGTVVVAQSSEPKTLNPVLAADQATRDALSALSADLVHINRQTLATEPALAERVAISPDGRRYTVTLRENLRFSDGTPLTADDVVFTFRVYLDPEVNSPQRDLLIVNDVPIAVSKISPRVVRFDLAAPYAPGERLFDSFWILPKHRLERAYVERRFTQAWTLGASPDEVVTAGPFHLKEYVPGQRLVLERNRYYWKHDDVGRALPYLDRLALEFVGDANAQLARLLAHEVNAAGRLRPEDLPRLEQSPQLAVRDAGPSLEYNFLFFNWSAAAPRASWFRSLDFRRAVAHAIDRDAIVRIVYQGRGSLLSSQVTPGNRLWQADAVSRYAYDPARAAQLLAAAGFRLDANHALVDHDGTPVEFSLMVSATNQARRKMATLIQEDLARIGVRVRLQPTDFGVMMDAVLKTRKFDAALWGVVSGDADPNADVNVWTTGGTLHVWNLRAPGDLTPRALEPWESEVDRLMTRQMTTTAFAPRKAAYDRVQQIVTANLPVVFLATPHVLAAADRNIGNFEPAALDPVLLWNAERLFWKSR